MAIKANYTSIFRLFTLHFFLLILSLSSFAQQNYPVQANLVIIPPNSPYLSDYVSQSGKMLVNLFMKDLTKSQYPSRLHVKIEGSGITIESKNDFYVEPFYLNGGEMTMLTGDDLAPYLNPQNLVYQGVDLKRSGGKLPDGLYQITVQVKDYYRKSVVSNAGFSLLSVFLSYPPIINLPFNQAKVRAMDPQNVMFQWTPRHTGSINAAYNVAYKFTLTEVFPGRDPNDAIRSTRPFYETFTDLTMLVYGPGEPALTPGNQYAVKVQAVEADGRDIFINNGNSEVSSFTYGDKCSVPTNMLAQVSGRSTLKVSWNETPLQQAFTVRYRQADNATAEWFEKEVFTAQAELQGLRQGYTYEYQIKAQCGYGYGDYSASERFSMPDENVTSGTLVCGKAPDGKTLDKSKLLPVLSPPMIFMAGDFPVVVTKAAGQNGTFTGTGTVGIPFLNSLSFKVSFTNITINTDLQLVAGVVIVAQQSLLESKKQLVASITVTPDANGKVTVASQNGLPVIIEASFDTSQTPVFNPESKILTVYTTSKDMPKLEVTISGDLPQTIQDKDENTYEIAKDGTVKALGKVPVSELLAGSNISAKELSTNRAKVVFQKSGNQSYGFDVKKDTEFGNAAFEGNYQQVSGKFISWKSVETGKSDEVLARFENLDQVNPIDPEKIEFHNGSDEKLSSSLNTSDNTFTIQIIGSPEGNDKEIYAFYPDGKLNLTKLNIASYQKIEKKVVIVPVNGAGNNLGAGTVQNYLNTVYQQAVVSWQLTKADNFQVDKALYDSKDDGLDVDNSNAMSAYTAEQKTLATLYKNDHPFENNTYYIFLIDRFSDANQTGYMVRSGQVGFVSVSDETTTMHSIAHELGHGAFNLKHSWEEYGTSQGTTQNLMDYSGGTDLIKAQWAYIRNPDWVFRAFEGDEDGAIIVSLIEWNTFMPVIDGEFIVAQGAKITFVAPAFCQKLESGEYLVTVENKLTAYKALNDAITGQFRGFYAVEQLPPPDTKSITGSNIYKNLISSKYLDSKYYTITYNYKQKHTQSFWDLIAKRKDISKKQATEVALLVESMTPELYKSYLNQDGTLTKGDCRYVDIQFIDQDYTKCWEKIIESLQNFLKITQNANQSLLAAVNANVIDKTEVFNRFSTLNKANYAKFSAAERILLLSYLVTDKMTGYYLNSGGENFAVDVIGQAPVEQANDILDGLTLQPIIMKDASRKADYPEKILLYNLDKKINDGIFGALGGDNHTAMQSYICQLVNISRGNESNITLDNTKDIILISNCSVNLIAADEDIVKQAIYKLKEAADKNVSVSIESIPLPKGTTFWNRSNNVSIGDKVYTFIQIEALGGYDKLRDVGSIGVRNKIQTIERYNFYGDKLFGLLIDNAVYVFVKTEVEQKSIFAYLNTPFVPGKSILIMVNGYRFSPVEYPNTDNGITKNDRYQYWAGIDKMFVNRLKPKNVFYADGHMSITTSNHISQTQFASSMASSATAAGNKALLASAIALNAIAGVGLSATCYHNGDCVHLDKISNTAGFTERRNNGTTAGRNLIKMLTDGSIQVTKDDKGNITDSLDIVAHSMGFAYALGMMDAIKQSGLNIRLAGFYIIAPENGAAGFVELNFAHIWHYGSNEGKGGDPLWLQDGVAPQCPINGIENNRAYIPDDAPKGFVESHSIGNYNWIFKRNYGMDGYVQERK